MTIFRDLNLRNPELLRDRAFVGGTWIEAPPSARITVTDPFDGSPTRCGWPSMLPTIRKKLGLPGRRTSDQRC
jgi:hypothetical protein